MNKLEVKLDDMRTSSRNLSRVHADFDSAQSSADNGADHIGHRRLESVVRDFASNWTTHRSRLLKSMSGLSESAKGIADTFSQVDGELADKLKGGMDDPSAAGKGV